MTQKNEALDALRLSAKKDFWAAATIGVGLSLLTFTVAHVGINHNSLLAGVVSVVMAFGAAASVGGFVSRGVDKLLKAQLAQIIGDDEPPKPNLKLV